MSSECYGEPPVFCVTAKSKQDISKIAYTFRRHEVSSETEATSFVYGYSSSRRPYIASLAIIGCKPVSWRLPLLFVFRNVLLQ